jgi:hypothetical protein
MDESAVATIRARIADFAARWTALAPGEAIVLQWPAQA